MKNILALIVLLPFLFSCEESDDPRMDPVLDLTADLENGKLSYDKNCASCHGADGSGTPLGESIKSENDPREILEALLEGEGTMPSYETLSDQELADLTAYSQSL